jgi:hypothetical protein
MRVIEQFPPKYRHFITARREIARHIRQPTEFYNKPIVLPFEPNIKKAGKFINKAEPSGADHWLLRVTMRGRTHLSTHTEPHDKAAEICGIAGHFPE